MSRFEGRVAIVTGAGRENGIGEAIAMRLASEGADVAIVDLGRQREGSVEKFGGMEEMHAVAEKIVKATGRKILPIACNVSDEEQVTAMVDRVAADFGRIDMLFNNAAAAMRGGPVEQCKVVDLDTEAWDYAFGATTRSTFLCARQVAKKMIAAGEGGSIVNTISGAAFHGVPGASAYTSAKLAVTALTRTLAIELAPHKIRVNGFSPGMVHTQWIVQNFEKNIAPRMGGNKSPTEALTTVTAQIVPLGRPGKPVELAAVAAFLASDDAAYVTGQIINVDGGSSAK